MGRREDYDPEEWDEMCDRFADPGGDSALHRASSRVIRDGGERLERLTAHFGLGVDERGGLYAFLSHDATKRHGSISEAVDFRMKRLPLRFHDAEPTP
jgi:hypothetical protein